MTSNNAEEAQQNMQEGLLKILNDIDKSHLRKIQLLMHRCAAKCCENTTASLDETQSCVLNCSTDVRRAQELVGQEIGAVQDRLNLCIQDCRRTLEYRDVNDKSSEGDVMNYKRDFDACAIKCFDEGRMKMFPALVSRLKTNLDSTINKK